MPDSSTGLTVYMYVCDCLTVCQIVIWPDWQWQRYGEGFDSPRLNTATVQIEEED